MGDPRILTGIIIIQSILILVGLIYIYKRRPEQRSFSSLIAQRHLKRFFEQSPIPLVLLDSQQTILRANPAFCTLLGYNFQELEGKSALSITHSDDAEKSTDRTNRIFADMGESMSLEKRYIRKDGKIVWARLHGVAFDSPDKRPFAVGFIVDLTMQRKVEEATWELNQELELKVQKRTASIYRLNQEIESFIHSLAHDLRQPLRGINGFSKILIEDYSEVLDWAGKDYLERISEDIVLMGELIDDLLQLSNIARGDLKPVEINLSELARKVMVGLVQDDSSRVLELKVTPDLIDVCDQALMVVVLDSLLENAWKYTSTREKTLIEFGSGENEAGPYYFIRDNGVGFDMAYSEKLFGVFERLHRRGEFEGTGIGLATVQRIISRHGGRVWAEGAVDEGACFYFSLNSENTHQ